MAHDVFITYSSKDKKTADGICHALEGNAIRCWYAPRNIRSGANWAASIIDGLNNSRIMILVWSANSNASPHVTREVHHAFRKNVTVIPFRLEDVAPTQELEYYLESVQWFDATTPPLEDNLKRLVEHVRTLLPADEPPLESNQARKSAEALERERALEEARVRAVEEEAAIAEHKRAEEAEKRRLEDERQRANEAERQRLEAAAGQRAEAEAERNRVEEQERLRLEAAQKEAAEEERRRLEAEAERNRVEEQERLRLEAAQKEAEEENRWRVEAEAARKATEQQAVLAAKNQREPLARKQSEPLRHAVETTRVLSEPTPDRRFPVLRIVIPGVVLVILALVVLYALKREPRHDDQVASTANESSIPTPTLLEPTPVEPTPKTSPSESKRTPSPAKPTPARPTPEQRKDNSSPAEPKQTPHVPISGGVLNGKAVHLVQPPYPPIARSAHASGQVIVQILIDENGDVIAAHANSGHPLLQAAAVNAARASKFMPTKLAGQPVKVNGVVIYNFVAQ